MEDHGGRPIMVAYLDGKPKDSSREIGTTAYNAFLAEQSEMLKKLKRKPLYKVV